MKQQIEQISPLYPSIDIHCHGIAQSSKYRILSLDTHELPASNISNANSASVDSDIDEYFPNINRISGYFSIGIHPWFIENQNIPQALQILHRYKHHPKLLAIGECGLDKTISTDLSLQTNLFQQQIELSEQWRKPLIIHCVKAFNEIIKLKESGNFKQPWIVHGFNKHPSVAAQLVKHGCHLSLGKALLNEKGNAARVLQIIPLDRLFLETDGAEDISIDTIYSAAAKILDLTVDALRQVLFRNFKRVFFQ